MGLGFIPKSAPREVMVNALRLVFSGGIYIPPEALARPEPKEAPPAPGHPISPADLDFTERQMEVLALMMLGKSNKAINENYLEGHIIARRTTLPSVLSLRTYRPTVVPFFVVQREISH